MKLQFIELNHAAIHVKNLEQSDQFYGVVLEMHKLPRPAFNFRGSWFAIGKQQLHLIEDTDLIQSARDHHHFAIQVADISTLKNELMRKGIKNLREQKRPDGATQLFLKDPDGYVIEFYSV